MKIEKFEDIIAWQKSDRLTRNIYLHFSNCRDYSFRDQIQRASISIMNNIAEGFERRTNKEFINLRNEMRSQKKIIAFKPLVRLIRNITLNLNEHHSIIIGIIQLPALHVLRVSLLLIE